MPHQERVLNRSLTAKEYAWFLDPGLGKTYITLYNANELYKAGEIDAVVIISHLSVAENWILNEVPKLVNGYHKSLLAPAGAPRYEELIQFPKLAILGIHKEALRNKTHFRMLERFMKARKCMLVLDESTWCKTPTAAQSRAVYKLEQLALYKRILTGTPAPNGPMDYFGQFRFLLPQIFGQGKMSKVQFISQFCRVVPQFFGGRRIDKVDGWSPDGQQRLGKLVKDHCIRMTKEDAGLALPEKNYMSFDIPLPGNVIDMYNNLKKEEYLCLLNEDGSIRAEVEAQSVVAALVKLHQLTSGWVKMGGGVIEQVHDAKLRALKSILQAWEGEQVIIWAHFRHDIDMIKEMLGDKAVRIYGGISNGERQTALADFFQGRKQYLVANPASVGHGLTLVNASKVIYYSNSWNYEFRAQSEDRVHRIGQKAKVVDYVDLVTPGTVDVDIAEALVRKESFQRPLIQYVHDEDEMPGEDEDE